MHAGSQHTSTHVLLALPILQEVQFAVERPVEQATLDLAAALDLRAYKGEGVDNWRNVILSAIDTCLRSNMPVSKQSQPHPYYKLLHRCTCHIKESLTWPSMRV